MHTPYDIFISYRRTTGAQYARIIQLMLAQRGYKVFLDYDELKDGVFGKRIKAAINEAPVFILMLSKGALERCSQEGDWVREEILLAMQEGKKIIPINPDKSAIVAPGYSPYTFCKNNPNIMVDSNGYFPIFINGRVSDDSERGSFSYWSKGLREMVKQKTGYNHSQFKFVDGDKGFWPSTRYNAGIAQGKADAAAIYAVLKSSAKDGVITEQLQIISHSRGSAFASGYMQSVSAEIRNLANKDNMTFSYGNDKIVEYSINIGPHQSNYISYEKSGTVNVNISHFGDVLSGNDAKGNVINIHSCMPGLNQHGNATFIPELEFVLPVLEAGGSKSDIKKRLTNLYQQWNNKHPGQFESTVE